MNNDYIKLVRRLKLWVVLLAVLNITIISTIGVNKFIAQKKEATSERSIKGVNSFFVYYLQLSEDQTQTFDSLSNDYKTKLKEVGLKLRSVKERMNIPEIEKDTVAMNKIYEDFISAQSLNRDLAVQFYESIRGICNPKQVKRFNDVISKTTI